MLSLYENETLVQWAISATLLWHARQKEADDLISLIFKVYQS